MSDDEEEVELQKAEEGASDLANQGAEGDAQGTLIVPVWCNLLLKQQGYSYVAHAAYQTRHQPLAAVPLPNWLSAGSGKRRMDDSPAYRVASVKQTVLVYDAFASLGIVTVPIEPEDAQCLLAAEKAELLAAVGKGEPPDAAAAAAKPRRCAVTVLIPHASSCDDRDHLLDCMALLSRTRTMCGMAIRETRMAILADQDALFYAEHTGGRTMQGREGNAELVLTYATAEGKRNHVYVPLKTGKRGSVVYKILTKAIALAFSKAELPLPAALGHSSDVESCGIEGAYKKGMQEVNDEFFGSIASHVPAPDIDYRLSFGPPSGNKNFRIFLRIAPQHLDIDHPEAYFGLLLHKEGKEDELYDYAVAAMQEERKRVNQGAEAVVGLRPPATTREAAAQPHVLVVKATVVSFRDRVSCYGLRGAPGYRVSIYDNASMPKLVYELKPYTADFTFQKWAFPCTQQQTESLDGSFKWEQSQVAKDAVRAYGKICGLSEGHTRAPPSPIPPKNSVFKIKKLGGKPCKEGAILARMSGVPLGGAFRLGEVLESVELTHQSMPVLRAFLTKSIARLGRNAPMVEALAQCTALEEKHAEQLKTAHKQIQTLQDQVLQLEVESRRAVAPKIEPCSVEAMTLCLDSMNLKSTYGVLIPMPISMPRAQGIVNVLARARGVDVSVGAAKVMAWAHWEACTEMTTMCTAAYIGTALHRCPIYIVMELKDGTTASFLKAKTNAAGAFSQLEHVSPMEMYDAPKKHASVILLKYLEKDKKLYALVPRS